MKTLSSDVRNTFHIILFRSLDMENIEEKMSSYTKIAGDSIGELLDHFLLKLVQMLHVLNKMLLH